MRGYEAEEHIFAEQFYESPITDFESATQQNAVLNKLQKLLNKFIINTEEWGADPQCVSKGLFLTSKCNLVQPLKKSGGLCSTREEAAIQG